MVSWACWQNGHWKSLHSRMVTGAVAGPRVMAGSMVAAGGSAAPAAVTPASRSTAAASRV